MRVISTNGRQNFVANHYEKNVSNLVDERCQYKVEGMTLITSFLIFVQLSHDYLQDCQNSKDNDDD